MLVLKQIKKARNTTTINTELIFAGDMEIPNEFEVQFIIVEK